MTKSVIQEECDHFCNGMFLKRSEKHFWRFSFVGFCTNKQRNKETMTKRSVPLVTGEGRISIHRTLLFFLQLTDLFSVFFLEHLMPQNAEGL